MTDRVNRLLLEAASLPGHQSTVEALIRDHGANIHHSHPLNGWTALHWATKRENVGLIRFLLSNGADPLAKSLDGQSAVDIARDGDDEVVNVFSEFEIEITATKKEVKKSSFVPNYLRCPVLSPELAAFEAKLSASGPFPLEQSTATSPSVNTMSPETTQNPTEPPPYDSKKLQVSERDHPDRPLERDHPDRPLERNRPDRPLELQYSKQPSQSNNAIKPPHPSKHVEIIVLWSNGTNQPRQTLGSILTTSDCTVTNVLEQINNELDIPDNQMTIDQLGCAKLVADELVPVSKKQRSFSLERLMMVQNAAVVKLVLHNNK